MARKQKDPGARNERGNARERERRWRKKKRDAGRRSWRKNEKKKKEERERKIVAFIENYGL